MDNTISRTLEHVSFLARYLHKRDMHVVISIILLDLRILPKSAGYYYLKAAVELFYKDPTQLITYGLYVDVARRFGRHVSSAQVERAMRRAIRIAWENRDDATWKLYFPSGVPDGKHGYTTSSFVSGIAEILRLWEGCCENDNAPCKEGEKR